MNVVGNIEPAKIQALCVYARTAQVQRAEEIESQLQPLYYALSITTNPITTKYILHVLWPIQAGIRLPLVWMPESLATDIKAVLVKQLNMTLSA